MTSVAVTFRDPEQQRLRVPLAASLTASREARHALEDVSHLDPFPYLKFTGQLLTAELVGNVLRHTGIPAGERFDLLIDCDQDTLRVEVVDGGDGFNPLALLGSHTANDDRHRGIALVNILADRWGYHTTPGECRMWFELDLVPGRRPWRGREPIQTQ